jgi:hypothetical protein
VGESRSPPRHDQSEVAATSRRAWKSSCKDDRSRRELDAHGAALAQWIAAAGDARLQDDRRHGVRALERNLGERVLAEDQQRVDIGAGAGGRQHRPLGTAGVRERREVGTEDEANILDRADLVLADRLHLRVFGDRDEAGDVADVVSQIGMADRDIGRLDRLRPIVRAGGEDLGDLLRLLRHQGTDDGADLRQRQRRVDVGALGAVGVEDVGPALDGIVDDQLLRALRPLRHLLAGALEDRVFVGIGPSR